MNSKIIISALLGMTLFLAVLVASPDTQQRLRQRLGLTSDEQVELTPFYHRIVKYHRRVSGNAPERSVQFIGDSFIQGLCVSAVASPAVNFGIGGDTTLGILQRIPQYPSLQTASSIVLAAGFNDMWRHANDEIVDNFQSIVRSLPADVPLVMMAVFPVDERVEPAFAGRNARIAALNVGLEALCKATPRCTFLDINGQLRDESGNLSMQYQDGDGLHLSSVGNAVWISALKPLVAKHTAAN